MGDSLRERVEAVLAESGLAEGYLLAARIRAVLASTTSAAASLRAEAERRESPNDSTSPYAHSRETRAALREIAALIDTNTGDLEVRPTKEMTMPKTYTVTTRENGQQDVTAVAFVIDDGWVTFHDGDHQVAAYSARDVVSVKMARGSVATPVDAQSEAGWQAHARRAGGCTPECPAQRHRHGNHDAH